MTGKARPDPTGFVAEKRNIPLAPVIIPNLGPNTDPAVKASAVTNSILGTMASAHPDPTIKATNIATNAMVVVFTVGSVSRGGCGKDYERQ